MEDAYEELYEIRKTEKTGITDTVEPKVERRKLPHGYWECPSCYRINSAKAKICTRCGETRK